MKLEVPSMSRLTNGRPPSGNAARDNPGSASRVGRGKTPECYGRRQKTANFEILLPCR
jgi:hypothetical protein